MTAMRAAPSQPASLWREAAIFSGEGKLQFYALSTNHDEIVLHWGADLG